MSLKDFSNAKSYSFDESMQEWLQVAPIVTWKNDLEWLEYADQPFNFDKLKSVPRKLGSMLLKVFPSPNLHHEQALNNIVEAPVPDPLPNLGLAALTTLITTSQTVPVLESGS